MSRNVKYAYVELDKKYRYMSIAQDIYNVKDVFDSERYRSQKEIDKINEVYYGGRMKNISCAFCKASAPGVYHGSSNGYSEECFADTFFSCQIDGTEGTYQTELHFFKTERGYQRIAYCSCPAFKKDEYHPCKHLEALSMHIRDHYEFDENNYTIIEPPYALDMAKDNETSSRQNKLVNYDKLIKYIPYFDTVYLRLYEKMCRFLKDGIHSFGNYTSKWNDLPVREKFKERGMYFDSFTRNFIENTMDDRSYYHMLKCGRNDDFWWLKFDANRNREEGNPTDYTLFKTFDDRLENIYLSTATCPMAFDTINDFYRIFDSYARATIFEYDGKRIKGKYIVVPTFFQAIMLPVDEVSDGFYENFKLGSSSLEKAVILDISGTKYYFLYDRTLSRLVKKSGNSPKPKVAPTPRKPSNTSTNQTNRYSGTSYNKDNATNNTVKPSPAPVTINKAEQEPVPSSNKTTHVASYTDKAAGLIMAMSIIGTIALIIAFIVMLCVKGTVSYRVMHDGEIVTTTITKEIKMRDYFGGFMIFLFVLAIIGGFVAPAVRTKHTNAAFAYIGVVFLDFIMLIGYFTARSAMNSYVPPAPVSTYIPVVDSIKVGGGYGFGVFLMFVAIITHIVATVFAIKNKDDVM